MGKNKIAGGICMNSVNRIRLIVLALACVSHAFSPQFNKILFPKKGFSYLSEEFCECPIKGSEDDVVSARVKDVKLFVRDCFHPGTGHGHSIAIGIGGLNDSIPRRGIYFNTSTTGWRTLRQFNDGGLPWLLDVDGNGESEVVIWQSFSDTKYYTNGTNGLAPFVYRYEKGALKLDKKLTSIVIGETLKNYQITMKEQEQQMGRNWTDKSLYERLMKQLVDKQKEYSRNK